MESRAPRFKWLRLPDIRYMLACAGAAVFYVLAAWLGLAIGHVNGQVSVVWPPSAIALVIFLLAGARYWPGVFIGALLANATFHEPLWVSAGIAIGNTLEGLIGMWLLRYAFKFKNAFAAPADVFSFAYAALISTVIAALNGTTWLALGGLVHWHSFGPVALSWWEGDATGDLVCGPFLLAYLNRDVLAQIKGRLLEFALIMAAVLAASVAVLTFHRPIVFVLFPIAVWVAIRLTQVGVVSSVIVITAVAIWAISNKLGPFMSFSPVATRYLALQLFISVLSATCLIVAMAITERLAAEADLKRQQKKLVALEEELKEANRRMTNILTGILDDTPQRRGHNGNGRSGESKKV